MTRCTISIVHVTSAHGTRIVNVCIPTTELYPFLVASLAVFLQPMHSATFQALCYLVWALLSGQSLHVSDLSRALPNLKAVGARQAMRRVRRVLGRSHLMSDVLTPRLIDVALRLVHDAQVTLVLDSTRCVFWEIFTVGIVFHGRVLPIAWSLLPYPWPKKSFTPTVIALLNRVMKDWPVERPVHLLADRGFPSLKLFTCLEHWRRLRALGYTIRLRAGDWVYLANGRAVKLADLMKALAANGCSWTIRSASYRHGGKSSTPVFLVIGHSQPEYPPHQRGPADRARREARAKRRQAHLLSKGQLNAPDTDGVWALLTTASTCEEARQLYVLRFRTEGTYRDLKEWGLEAVAARETDRSHLDALIGLAALAYSIQASIGAVAGCADSLQAQARQRQWTTADRLSIFWRGRQVLHDCAFDWRPWLRVMLTALVENLTQPSPAGRPNQQPTPAQITKEAA